MKIEQKTFNTITGIVFFIIAFFHLLRAIYGWEVVFNGSAIPVISVSTVAVIIAGYLSYTAFKLTSKNGF